MKKILIYTFVGNLALAAVSPCLAADSPWNGTWKSNLAKSKVAGATFTVTAKGEKTYHYSDGVMEYDYTCDGTSYSIIADRTETCLGDATTGYDFTTSANGKLLSKCHNAISADNRTKTMNCTSMLPDGTAAHAIATYERMGEGSGIAGKWRRVKEELSKPEVAAISISGGMIHMEYPADKEVIDAKLDGNEAPWIGPNILEGLFASFRAEAPNQIRYSVKYKDKVLNESIFTLSKDGQTYTRESWTPGKMAEKQTELYEKQ